MSDHFFAYLSRMRHIERWSLMRCAEKENIQEHSHMVAVIAHTLGLIRRDVFSVPCVPERYAAAALYHDIPEILTGDLPTPIKYYSPEIRDAYRAVEALACEKLAATLPPELRSSLAPWIMGEDAEEAHSIVKAADKLSAYVKCIEERRAGNDDFLSAEKTCLASLRSYAMPEVDYFIEHFIPAFELTLDELGMIEEGEGT